MATASSVSSVAFFVVCALGVVVATGVVFVVELGGAVLGLEGAADVVVDVVREGTTPEVVLGSSFAVEVEVEVVRVDVEVGLKGVLVVVEEEVVKNCSRADDEEFI